MIDEKKKILKKVNWQIIKRKNELMKKLSDLNEESFPKKIIFENVS